MWHLLIVTLMTQKYINESKTSSLQYKLAEEDFQATAEEPGFHLVTTSTMFFKLA